MTEAVAIIPARGGSQRVPRKNIRLFHGRPIIAYSIETALESRCFQRVIVSTEDDEIAAVAQGLGAEVPFMRPAGLADAHTGTMEVMRHALAALAPGGTSIEWACCIYATAPFLSAEHLRQGLAELKRSNRSFAFSVTSFGFPIQRALRLRSDGTLDAMWPENRSVRSQDLEPAYHDAAQFYWGRGSAFLEGRILFSPESVPVLLPRHLVHDIDTEEDWHAAELAYAAIQRRHSV